MQIGFRPRLKARPSLYDLIKNRNIESLSTARRHRASSSLSLSSTTTELALAPEHFPLPSSPAPSRPGTPIPYQLRIEQAPVVAMPPKRQVQLDEDGEEQYGESQLVVMELEAGELES